MTRMIRLLPFILMCISCSSNTDREKYMERGRAVSVEAQKALIGKLHAQLEEGGANKALEYCNLNALNLTQEVASKHSVGLSRIAVRNRNPENATRDARELELMEYYQNPDLRSDTLIQSATALIYYKPIPMGMPTCLYCHGTPYKDIDSSTVTLIKQLYPEDKATGFEMGELRGMWRIDFGME